MHTRKTSSQSVNRELFVPICLDGSKDRSGTLVTTTTQSGHAGLAPGPRSNHRASILIRSPSANLFPLAAVLFSSRSNTWKAKLPSGDGMPRPTPSIPNLTNSESSSAHLHLPLRRKTGRLPPPEPALSNQKSPALEFGALKGLGGSVAQRIVRPILTLGCGNSCSYGIDYHRKWRPAFDELGWSIFPRPDEMHS